MQTFTEPSVLCAQEIGNFYWLTSTVTSVSQASLYWSYLGEMVITRCPRACRIKGCFQTLLKLTLSWHPCILWPGSRSVLVNVQLLPLLVNPVVCRLYKLDWQTWQKIKQNVNDLRRCFPVSSRLSQRGCTFEKRCPGMKSLDLRLQHTVWPVRDPGITPTSMFFWLRLQELQLGGPIEASWESGVHHSNWSSKICKVAQQQNTNCPPNTVKPVPRSTGSVLPLLK